MSGRSSVVAWWLLPIQQHEVTVSDELIQEVQALVGGEAIELLLIDREVPIYN